MPDKDRNIRLHSGCFKSVIKMEIVLMDNKFNIIMPKDQMAGTCCFRSVKECLFVYLSRNCNWKPVAFNPYNVLICIAYPLGQTVSDEISVVHLVTLMTGVKQTQFVYESFR